MAWRGASAVNPAGKSELTVGHGAGPSSRRRPSLPQGPDLPPELRLSEIEYRFAKPDSPDNIIFEVKGPDDRFPVVKVCNAHTRAC